jgi:hypothetical protein
VGNKNAIKNQVKEHIEVSRLVIERSAVLSVVEVSRWEGVVEDHATVIE